MKKKGTLALAGLISIFSWLFISSFIGVNSIDELKSAVLTDSLPKDTIQLLLDKYCNQLDSCNAITDEIDKRNTQINNDEREKNKLKDIKNSINEASTNALKAIKTDSCNNINEFCKILTLKYKEVRDLDSAQVEKIKKKIEENKISIKNIEKDRISKNTNCEKLLKDIQKYFINKTGSITVRYKGIKYNFFIADLNLHSIRMHLINPKDKNHFLSIGAVKNYLESEKIQPLMITNAGMYRQDNNPEGLYIEENSKSRFALDTGKYIVDANFYLKPNGVFFIDSLNTAHIDTTEEFARLDKEGKLKVKIATQSGPMLVINGKIHPYFTEGSNNAKIRSGVGIISDKRVIFAITIDPANFYDFATFFKDIINCKNALFLDGAISQMFLNDISPNTLGGHFGPIISISKKQ